MLDDCLIIGGGVIGLSLAYELAGRSLRVQVVDQGHPGQQASWAGAGILPPGSASSSAPPVERLAHLSEQIYPLWSAELRETTGLDNQYRRSGGIYLARTAEAVRQLETEATAWQTHGIRATRLTPPEVVDLEPGLRPLAESPGDRLLAFKLKDECQLRNPRHLQALQAGCLNRGVRITPGVAVERFETTGDRVTGVISTTGRIAAGTVCVTSGSWSGPLGAQLGVRLPVKPIRGQIVLLRCPQPPIRHILTEGFNYLVARDDGRVLVGATLEDVGYESRATAAGTAELPTLALSLVPSLANATVERAWAGLRPGTADGLPYLGRIEPWQNAILATGHYRSGVRLAPGTARLIAQLLTGESPELDLKPYRIDR